MRRAALALMLIASLPAVAQAPIPGSRAITLPPGQSSSREVPSIEALVARARQRDADAEYALALLTYHGTGVAANASQAFRLMERAAGRAHLEAQHALGFMHQYGIGTPVNAQAALRSYLAAAARGHARAQTTAGWMLLRGEGAARDEAAARGWFEKAAAQNLREAQYNLAVVLEEGRGGAKNPVGAVAAYSKAADAGIAEASLRLARLLEHGYANYEPAPAAALKRYIAAAEAGLREAQLAAGRLYLDSAAANRDVQRSVFQAVYWLEAAGRQGERDAFVQLARWFDRGEGGAAPAVADYPRAADYYRRAADAGDQASLVRLAYLLEEKKAPESRAGELDSRLRAAARTGDAEIQFRLAERLAARGPKGAPQAEGVLEEAVAWYRRAAEQAHTRAALALGIALEEGRGTAKNPAEALRWYQAAAKADLAEAHFRLGVLYDDGTGVSRDSKVALERYAEAARLGHERAQGRIDRMVRPPSPGGLSNIPQNPANDNFRGLR